MSDIIQLLPDAVANQIAAGEVIQRPASVVKELIENSIDAEAKNITVNIKDAGRTLIQIIDDGKGMSDTDARMAFERHATSKIREANDLFAIQSMGFRGEALASIAAVADVELKTKLHNEELGTYIHIKGSQIIKQETISCPEGSNFSVKNLFFNIPARRKFLKKDSTEFKHVVTEFKKVALANPEISFSLIHNEKIIFKLNKGNTKQRISEIFGKSIYKSLVPVESNTSILKISGFIGKPEIAKKRNEEQYFFVNKRFMKHPYFYKAIILAYDQILKPDIQPSFFLYFEINPSKIDINIHPAKIEINFDDSHGIFQLLRASIRQALGKYNVVPTIDFDTEGSVDIPYSGNDNLNFENPKISDFNDYNPFENTKKTNQKIQNTSYHKEKKEENWERLFESFESKINTETSVPEQKQITETENNYKKIFQLKNKYIVTPVKSGIMLISITRAHERILFEDLLNSVTNNNIVTQKTLYPIKIQLTAEDAEYLEIAVDTLLKIG
ncbi:MAG: DNA mismatch repair endonuclease MutL, partial [Chlorobi bacterium]|nr:DNA mismatch repair endonuclease MutL [Chlorobiota bacterium]